MTFDEFLDSLFVHELLANERFQSVEDIGIQFIRKAYEAWDWSIKHAHEDEIDREIWAANLINESNIVNLFSWAEAEIGIGLKSSYFSNWYRFLQGYKEDFPFLLDDGAYEMMYREGD